MAATKLRPIDFAKAVTKSTKIKNAQELETAIQAIKQAGVAMPTVLRKAMKQITLELPRRGGPGRQRKLQGDEVTQVCDQIALFIRQGHNLKQALQKVSELTP